MVPLRWAYPIEPARRLHLLLARLPSILSIDICQGRPQYIAAGYYDGRDTCADLSASARMHVRRRALKAQDQYWKVPCQISLLRMRSAAITDFFCWLRASVACCTASMSGLLAGRCRIWKPHRGLHRRSAFRDRCRRLAWQRDLHLVCRAVSRLDGPQATDDGQWTVFVVSIPVIALSHGYGPFFLGATAGHQWSA